MFKLVKNIFLIVILSCVQHANGFIVDGSTTNTATWIRGQKKLTSLGVAPTDALHITFTNLEGIISPLQKGAYLKLYVHIAGSILVIITQDSINYYQSELYVLPGATAVAPCTMTVINQDTTLLIGNSIVVTAAIQGNGLFATIQLVSTAPITSQDVMLFYEINSDNIASVN